VGAIGSNGVHVTSDAEGHGRVGWRDSDVSVGRRLHLDRFARRIFRVDFRRFVREVRERHPVVETAEVVRLTTRRGAVGGFRCGVAEVIDGERSPVDRVAKSRDEAGERFDRFRTEEPAHTIPHVLREWYVRHRTLDEPAVVGRGTFGGQFGCRFTAIAGLIRHTSLPFERKRLYCRVRSKKATSLDRTHVREHTIDGRKVGIVT
jgi:hypothetical protein